jgi:hypothetical protein
MTSFLLTDARAQVVPNWNEAVSPPGQGDWFLATNHLARTKPSPQMFRSWDEQLTIESIIHLQGCRLGKHATAYTVTLIWYTSHAALEPVEVSGPPSPAPPSLLPPISVPDESTLEDSDGDLPSLASLLNIPKHLRHKRSILDAIPDREKGRYHDFTRDVTPGGSNDNGSQYFELNKEADKEGDSDKQAERGNIQSNSTINNDDGLGRGKRIRKATRRANGNY